MERLAMLFGVLLVALGLAGYLTPETFGTGKGGAEAKASPTALIPAGVGAALFLCGVVVALRPGARKHAMHAAAAVALIGAAGGFVPVISRHLNFSESAVVLASLMTGLCVLFVVLCVRSFIAARAAPDRAVPGTPPPG